MKKSKKNSIDHIYTASITLKNGKKIYAAQYGLKAFYIPIKTNK